MIKSIKKLPFPNWLATVDYSLTLYDSGINEDGEPKEFIYKTGKCIFSEKSKRIINNEGKQITLLGKVIIEGDIEPLLNNISDGSININGRNYEIYAGYRPRNPDGSIHHTEFEIQ